MAHPILSSAMAAGGEPPPPPSTHAGISAARESRWLGQEYADITKLREMAAKHDHLASKFQARQARVLVKIEKLRHVATILREKGDELRSRIPQIQSEIDQNNRQIQAANERTKGIIVGSDVTALHYRNQKLQQKIVDLKDKAQKLDHRAAIKTQKAAELKVKADQFLEHARVESLEAQTYRERADRLQRATEGDLGVAAARTATGTTPSDPSHRA
jgi:peptidoglycan hydrolase CwlO-like protein